MNYINIKRKLMKYKKIFNFLSKCKLLITGTYFAFFTLLFKFFPIVNNKIMIVNYSGKGFGDSGKYIVNELIKKNKNVEIYWAAKKIYKESIPQKVKYVKFNSIKYLFHLVTAKIWINNSRFDYGIQKRKKQFYIQTWHSSLRLKKIEKDAEDILNPQYIKTCKSDSKMIDLIISGCEFSTNIYKTSFWYNGEVKNTGTPRCDILFDEVEKEKLKQKIYTKYSIDLNKKIILYAPTFRKSTNEEDCYINFEKFANGIDKKYAFLVRFHPISKFNIKSNENIINVSNYNDMQELLCITDILITDYSGCCFDMMIKKGKCILFTKDLEDYLNKERNLYFNFKELPFPNAKNEEELLKVINEFDEKKYLKTINEFSKKIGLAEDGKASIRIAEIIEEVIKNEKI